MNDAALARRYAEAFVNTLQDLPGGLEELKAVARVYAESKELQRFLGSPEIGPEQKEKLLNRLWSDMASTQVLALLHLLLKWDRMEQLPALAGEAARVVEERQGVLRGTAVTAHPISSAETEGIARAVGRVLGKRVILERQVDPAVLGGVRVVVGTTLLDGSVRAHLDRIGEQLKTAKVN